MLTTFASVATVAFPLSRRVNTKVTRSLPMPVVMARNRTGYRRQVDCDLSVTWRTVVCKSGNLPVIAESSRRWKGGFVTVRRNSWTLLWKWGSKETIDMIIAKYSNYMVKFSYRTSHHLSFVFRSLSWSLHYRGFKHFCNFFYQFLSSSLVYRKHRNFWMRHACSVQNNFRLGNNGECKKFTWIREISRSFRFASWWMKVVKLVEEALIDVAGSLC